MSARVLTILLGTLGCLVPVQLVAADEACPELRGKDAAAHLEYLRGDRSKLAPPCVVAAIRYVGGKHYIQGIATVIQYLDYQDPDAGMRRFADIYLYPAIDALYGLGKRAVPGLIAVISESTTAERVRQNASEAIALIYGANRPEAIAALVSAARAQTDPIATNHLLDQARWLAARCAPASRNDCENAVVK